MVTPDSTATSPLLRRLNAVGLLDVLRGAGPVTAAQLMAATGLSRPTVHTVCDLLISHGWVTELDTVKTVTGVGRRARCYLFNAAAGYVFAIELGVERVSVLLADLRGEIVTSRSSGFQDAAMPADQRIRIARRLMVKVLAASHVSSDRVVAATVGVPAPVDAAGRVRASEEYLPGMAAIDVRQAIGKGYSCPVNLANDANLAVLGERWRGAVRGMDNVILISGYERLGAGIYLGGRLISGSNGTAGELGFLELVDKLGDTNGIAFHARTLGAAAVNRTAPDKFDAVNPGSLYGLAGGQPERVDAEMVYAAAHAGDDVAVEIMEIIADRMARTIAILATLLNPQVVVIAGPPATALDLILEPLNRRLPRYTLSPPVVLATTLGDNGVLLGATRMALDQVETRLLKRLVGPPAGQLDTSPKDFAARKMTAQR